MVRVSAFYKYNSCWTGELAQGPSFDMKASISERTPNSGRYLVRWRSRLRGCSLGRGAPRAVLYISRCPILALETNGYVIVCCLIPPSRTTLEPVRNEARSEAKKATKSPTSSGFPSRPMGMPVIVSLIRSSKALPDS